MSNVAVRRSVQCSFYSWFACQNRGNPCSAPLRQSVVKDKGLTPYILHINKASQSGLCLALTFPLWVLGTHYITLTLLSVFLCCENTPRLNVRASIYDIPDCLAGWGGSVSVVGSSEKQLRTHPPTHRASLVTLPVVWLNWSCRILPLAVVLSLKPSTFITTFTSPL